MTEKMKYLSQRQGDYDANAFLNELFEASKLLGSLEAKIEAYKFKKILVPMFRNKEVISSMKIEGTQTTITEVMEDNLSETTMNNDKALREYRNHSKALFYGTEVLNTSDFSDDLMFKLHGIMMDGILPSSKKDCIGHYKKKDNFIVNSAKTVVFTPPSYTETEKYMAELLDYMNNMTDKINPLIKVAIIHSQFESIHPFEDGNGRVGRLLVSLYLYKAKLTNVPFFYISEAIAQDKTVYYKMLSDSRENSYNNWIKYFLKKCIVQANSLISYIDNINQLYSETKKSVRDCVSSPKYEQIVECIFTQPVVSSKYLANYLSVSTGQAVRYLNKLEEEGVLYGDDRQRNRKYYFIDLLEAANRF